MEISGGVYTVMLGSSVFLEDSLFDNDSLFLGLQIGEDSEMTPRLEVVSVPWAKQAEVALMARSLDNHAVQALIALLPEGPTGSAGATGATGPQGPAGTTPADGMFMSLAIQDGVSGSEKVIFQVPDLTASYTLTLPVDSGTSGQVMSTNGSGVMSWVLPSSGPTGGHPVEPAVTSVRSFQTEPTGI